MLEILIYIGMSEIRPGMRWIRGVWKEVFGIQVGCLGAAKLSVNSCCGAGLNY